MQAQIKDNTISIRIPLSELVDALREILAMQDIMIFFEDKKFKLVSKASLDDWKKLGALCREKDGINECIMTIPQFCNILEKIEYSRGKIVKFKYSGDEIIIETQNVPGKTTSKTSSDTI